MGFRHENQFLKQIGARLASAEAFARWGEFGAIMITNDLCHVGIFKHGRFVIKGIGRNWENAFKNVDNPARFPKGRDLS